MKGTASSAQITTTVSALSDDRLLERTRELSGIEQHIEVVIIDHLREIDKRRLYLRIGFSSLFDYAVRELGYSDAAAWRRIKAMRLCADIDGARERLQDGSLTMNAAAHLQNAFDRQERKRALARRGAGTGATALQDGSATVRPATQRPLALDPSARRALVEQSAGKSTRQVQELLAEVDPELAVSADRVRPLGAGRWEIKAVIDEECRRGLERLKGLLSHVDPHMTLGQLVGRLVTEGLHRHDPAQPPRGRRTSGRSDDGARTSAPTAQADFERTSAPKAPAEPQDDGTSAAKRERDRERPVPSAKRPAPRMGDATSAPKPERGPDCGARSATKGPPGRAIPAAVKREVWERDRGRCSYVDRDGGRRCGSRHLLEIDHIVPYSRGGDAEPNNLRLLCAAHHRHRHAGAESRRRPRRRSPCAGLTADRSARAPATGEIRRQSVVPRHHRPARAKLSHRSNARPRLGARSAARRGHHRSRAYSAIMKVYSGPMLRESLSSGTMPTRIARFLERRANVTIRCFG